MEKKDNEERKLKKAYIIYILEILRKYTDEKNPLSQVEIMNLLEQDYEVSIERKAVKANLVALDKMGLPVCFVEGPVRNGEPLITGAYYDTSVNNIEDSELKMLIDSVLCSKFINAKQADQIVEWLKNQGSLSFKKYVSQTTFKSSEYGRHVHEGTLFMNIEDIQNAIDRNRKISFDYNDFNELGRIEVTKEDVVVSPYYTVVSNSQYYLICNVDGTDELSNFRMDKISNIYVLDDARTEMRVIDPSFDMQKYLLTSTYMFAGKDRRVKLRIKTSCFSDLFDYFGDFNIVKAESDEEYAVVNLRANLEGMYFWALQYGANVEILEPQELRDKLRETVASMTNKYSITDDDKYSVAVSEAKKEIKDNGMRFLRPVRTLKLAGISLKKKRDHLDIEDLYSLSVGYNDITDYSFINRYDSLRQLAIKDISALEGLDINLPKLVYISIGDRSSVWDDREQHIANLDFLKNCKALRSVDIERVEIDNLDALYELPELVEVLGLQDKTKLDLSKFSREYEYEEHRRSGEYRLVLSDRVKTRKEIRAKKEAVRTKNKKPEG